MEYYPALQSRYLAALNLRHGMSFGGRNRSLHVLCRGYKRRGGSERHG